MPIIWAGDWTSPGAKILGRGSSSLGPHKATKPVPIATQSNERTWHQRCRLLSGELGAFKIFFGVGGGQLSKRK